MSARRYTSSIRDAQVGQTREHLLAAGIEMLRSGDLDSVTLPRLAQAAGVSVPTVYRHFPTLADLHRALLEWIRPQIGQTPQRLLGMKAADLPRLPTENFVRFEEHAVVLRALMDSGAWNRVRVDSVNDRAKSAAEVLRACAPLAAQEALEQASGAVYVLASPQTWRWWRETWGLDAESAAATASWAMQVLLDAITAGNVPGKPSKKKRRRP